MEPSLNLRLDRGPSVWNRLDQRSTERQGQLMLVAAGVLLAVWWLRRGSKRTLWPLAIAAGVAGMTWSGFSFSNRRAAQPRAGSQNDTMVDVAVADSFPASDPPSSMQVE
jgi:hypothetical protein